MNLNVTLIQAELYWENKAKNLAHFSEKIEALADPTDIVVLPEMFNTGFSMHSETLAETMEGSTITWMKFQAKKSDLVIIGSLIVKENGNYYNRLLWVEPNGTLQHYDKRHLFRMAQENENFAAGEERLIVHYKGWRICPLICYDLRFPVWSRNKSMTIDKAMNSPENMEEAFDLLIYVANWPAARKAPWSKLLEARAIENQCYVVGVNRVGKDGQGIDYSGNSVLIDPKGEQLSSFPEHLEFTETLTLSLDQLNDFRRAFPVTMDGDGVEIIH